MAAAAILNFGKMSITLDWIKISCIKLYGKMHHSDAEMTTWPKVETGSYVIKWTSEAYVRRSWENVAACSGSCHLVNISVRHWMTYTGCRFAVWSITNYIEKLLTVYLKLYKPKLVICVLYQIWFKYIWTKFGTEHIYHTINTPEWPNSHKLKIQDGGGRHLEFRKMSITLDWIDILHQIIW